MFLVQLIRIAFADFRVSSYLQEHKSMLVYTSTKAGFHDDVMRNRIEVQIYDAFRHDSDVPRVERKSLRGQTRCST